MRLPSSSPEVTGFAAYKLWLPVSLAAWAPFANFAAENTTENISAISLSTYGLSVAIVALILVGTITIIFGRSAGIRSSGFLSALIIMFFGFSALEYLTGLQGTYLYVAYVSLTLIFSTAVGLFAVYQLPSNIWIAAVLVFAVLPTAKYVLRLSSLQAAPGSAIQDYTFNGISKPLKLLYPNVGPITSALPSSAESAKPTDGASFLGYSLRPKLGNSTFRIRVVANVYSLENNEAVVAVFLQGRSRPIKLESKTTSAGRWAFFDFVLDIPSEGRELNFDVRAGPASRGTVILNGPDISSIPSGIPPTSLTIREFKPAALRRLAKNARNVYYITLDAYPRADVLRDVFQYDNSPTIDFLSSEGFLVSNESFSNYMATYLSVPAALQQSYPVAEGEHDFWNRLPQFVDIVNGRNKVFEHFEDLGYFVSKLNFFDRCADGAFVDYCDGADIKGGHVNIQLGEEEYQLLELTPVRELLNGAVMRSFDRHPDLKDMDAVIRTIRYLDAPSPKFFYNHIFLPHSPYRFHSDCTTFPDIDFDGTQLATAKARFLDAVRCVNRKLKTLVEYLDRSDPGAIILINSDHGSAFTVRWELPYDEWPNAQIRERLGNFDAMRLPTECRDMFYDGITPVNYFELVFACIERRRPVFLEDRIYISTFLKSHTQYGQVWRYR